MKNYTLIFALLLVVAGGAAFLFFRPTSLSTLPTGEKAIENNDTIQTAGNDQPISNTQNSNNRYVEYSRTAYDQAATKRRVLFFYASWCPICRPADANFKQNLDKIPEDVVLLRVNYNDSDTDQEEKQLAQKYDITYQHTFVQIDSQGNPVTRWSGGQTNELLNNLK